MLTSLSAWKQEKYDLAEIQQSMEFALDEMRQQIDSKTNIKEKIEELSFNNNSLFKRRMKKVTNNSPHDTQEAMSKLVKIPNDSVVNVAVSCNNVETESKQIARDDSYYDNLLSHSLV